MTMNIPYSLINPLFQTLWENNESAMFLLDVRVSPFKVVAINKAQAERFKFQSESPQNQNFNTVIETFVSPQEKMSNRFLNNYIECINKKSALSYSESLLNKDNETLYLKTTLYPVINKQDEVSHILGFSDDITAQKKAAVLTDKTEKTLAKAQEAKTAFLSNMSHEIRTPLNGIISGLDLLTQNSACDIDTINAMRTCSERLMRQTEDILDFGRLNSNALQLKIEEFSLIDLINNAITQVKQRFKSIKNIKIITECTKMPLLLGDETRIEQIIINLLSNAYKFTDKGQICIKVCHKTLPFNRMLVSIAVKDSGIGISEDNISELFSPFHQLDNTSTRSYGGVGLGLTICHKLAHLMDANITVESSLGQGSTFSLEIPLSYVKKSCHLKNSRVTNTPKTLIKKNILVVEDNITNALLLKKMLENFGLTVHLSHDGEQALTLVKQYPFDLVMMDWHMPVMDGIECTGILKTIEPNIPIIGITANADEHSVQICKAAGMNQVLLKPIRIDDLSKCLSLFF